MTVIIEKKAPSESGEIFLLGDKIHEAALLFQLTFWKKYFHGVNNSAVSIVKTLKLEKKMFINYILDMTGAIDKEHVTCQSVSVTNRRFKNVSLVLV
jgi:putative sterol carrier protein